MPTSSAALSSLVEDFVTRLQALIDEGSSPGVEKAMSELAKGLFGSTPATTAAPKRRGRPPGSGKVAKVAKAAKTAKPKAAAGDDAMCRYPGCPNRNSGPRYHKFCRDHFTSLSVADREKYKAQWKASHGG